MLRALAASAVLAAAVGIGIGVARAGGSAVPPCTGSRLGGVFAVVAGSAGAGSISYDLRLRNRSAATCYVSGRPALRLLGRHGAPLPTRVEPTTPVGGRVVLRRGGYAAATARFSPDIPGPGEPQREQCEPTAYKVRVTPTGGGSLAVPVSPPTPVCLHGRIALTGPVAGKHGPRS